MRPLLDTFSLAVNDDRYTQILLILPMAVVLTIQRWWERGGKPQIWTPAAALLIAALLVTGAARWGHLVESSDLRLAIEMLALVGWWIAAFAFSFGLAALRVCCFPLFFLLCIVPIPLLILERIVAGLQHGSAIAAQWLFLLFRVPVVRDGVSLSIPGLDIDVTTECSSVRSSLMLLVTTMVLAHLLLQHLWRKVVLVLLAVPLSVAKNGLRICTIGMLGSRVDPSYLTGRLHRKGGIVFFLIALAGIFLVLWILRRGDGVQAPAIKLSPQKS